MLDPNDLDPGIRRTVQWLQARGFRTTDSGDGIAKFQREEPMEGALDYPHVVCVVAASLAVNEADRLADLVRGRGVKVVPNGRREKGQAEVEASYDPADCMAIIVLSGVGDAELFPDGEEQQGHPTREQRADRYAGRYFSRPDGSGLFRALRGATGAVLLTIRPDDTQGLTDPDELEALLLSGTLVARPDVTPPEGAGV